MAVRKIFVAQDLDHQGDTLACEEQQKLPLKRDVIEKIEPG